MATVLSGSMAPGMPVGSVAVLVPVEDWRRLKQAARPTLKELLLADEPRAELRLPARGRRHRRKPTAVA